MKKKELTLEQKYKKMKKRFIITLSVLIIFILGTACYIYLNYDYLAFKHFIAGHYIYTDALDRIFEEEIKRDVKGKYYAYFDNMVISVVTRRIREENNDKYTYLYTPEHYQAYQEGEKTEAQKSEIKILDDKTVYMRLTNFSKYTQKFVEDHIKDLGSRPNLIINLLDNSGGDIDAMVAICDWFLPKGSIIAKDDMRFMDWTYKAKKEQVLKYDQIIILQNNNTASASENMIAALNDNLDNVTLIGEKTFGKGIGQYTLPLRRGFAVKATTLLWNTPKGENIQGKGILPEIEYKGDDILQFALSQIK